MTPINRRIGRGNRDFLHRVKKKAGPAEEGRESSSSQEGNIVHHSNPSSKSVPRETSEKGTGLGLQSIVSQDWTKKFPQNGYELQGLTCRDEARCEGQKRRGQVDACMAQVGQILQHSKKLGQREMA